MSALVQTWSKVGVGSLPLIDCDGLTTGEPFQILRKLVDARHGGAILQNRNHDGGGHDEGEGKLAAEHVVRVVEPIGTPIVTSGSGDVRFFIGFRRRLSYVVGS